MESQKRLVPCGLASRISSDMVNTVRKWKSAQRRCKHCMLAVGEGGAKKFCPAADPFPGAWDGQNLISCTWSLPLQQTQFGEDWCTQFRVIVVTDPPTHTPTHKQTGPITIHCTTASVQCNYPSLCVVASQNWMHAARWSPTEPGDAGAPSWSVVGPCSTI